MYHVVDRNEDTLIICNGIKTIRVVVMDECILRISVTERKEFLTTNRDVVIGKAKGIKTQILVMDDVFQIKTKEMTVIVNKNTGALTTYNAQGVVMMKEPDRGGKHLTKVPVYLNDFKVSVSEDGSQDDEKKRQEINMGSGVKVNSDDYITYHDRDAYEIKLEFDWDKNEGLFGLGSHEEGYGNLRGKSRYLYQQNLKATVPFLYSTKGYGVLFDCGSLMTFHDDGYGSYVWMEYADELDYYMILANEQEADMPYAFTRNHTRFDSVIQGYRYLTGPAAMLPKWSFGYGQSKERYKTAQEMLDVVAEYRRRNVPLDFIVLDWYSWPEDLWGQKTFDINRFPNPDAMTEELHKMGAKFMMSIWPNMANGGPNQIEMLEHGYMLGNGSNYNAFAQEARELYWKQVKEGLLCHGVDAWWCDCTEPFEDDLGGEVKLEPHKRVKVNTDVSKKYLDPTKILQYSFYHSMGIYEGMRSDVQNHRLVNLTRSAYIGQHRFATITWAGDTCAKWDTLRRHIPEGVNFTATGEPYWTMDIGAFFSGKSSNDSWFFNGDYPGGCQSEGYRELFLRFLQYGAFLPMMRAHGTCTPREIWNFGEKGEPIYDSIEKYIRLRAALVPYIYSMAAMVSLADYTFLRGLAMEFPEDELAVNCLSQFMFGPSMMICPVLHSMTESNEMEVYLPAGTAWYDFETNIRYEGGQVITCKITLESIPVFVREGSILIMGEPLQYVDEKQSQLTVYIYSGKDAYFTLYEDEGDGFAYEMGEYYLTDFIWKEATHELEINKKYGKTYEKVSAGEFSTVII